MEVNPRLQVEHTITESISMTDLVKAQLLLSSGASLNACGLPQTHREPEIPPPSHSIQLRITSENVQNEWSLSIGKIQSFQFPTGNGIRVDTHLLSNYSSVVSADYDSLIAKVIVTAATWADVVRKAQRALEDTHISGVKTNLNILRGIVSHPDFRAGICDTQWLESKQAELRDLGQRVSARLPSGVSLQEGSASSSLPAISTANTLFRKGDAWSLSLVPRDAVNQSPSTQPAPPHHLELTRVLRNEFPASLSADILFTTPSTGTAAAKSTPYTITLSSTTASSGATTSQHRRGSPSDPSHVVIPFPGKLVEVLVDEGDVVGEGDVVCVVQQMKMELEVRTSRAGRVSWVMEVEEGEEVGEGVLAAVVEEEMGRAGAKL